MMTWMEIDRMLQAALEAANHHDSVGALKAIDGALAMLGGMAPPDRPELRRVASILRQGLTNARDGVWAMLYDQAYLDLDLVHVLPACLAAGAVDESLFLRGALDPYLLQSLEPFKGRMQRAM